MAQACLFIALYILGLCVTLTFGPRRSPILCCALAFPMGLAVWIASLLVLLAAGIPYNEWTALAAGIVLLLGHSWMLRSRQIAWSEHLTTIGWWTVGFVLCSVAVSSINLSRLSFDSMLMIMLGEGMAHQHGFDPTIWGGLGERSTFVIVAQSVASFIGLEYLYALPAVLGLSFIAVFVTILGHALDRMGCCRASHLWSVAVVSAALFGSYMVVFHIVYLHANMPSAVYLFCFASLFWLAETGEEPESYIPLSAIALLAFSLQRLEAPLIAVLFLALTLWQSELPGKTLSQWFGTVCGLLIVWYFVVMVHVPEDSRFLSASRLLAVACALGLAFAVWWARRWRWVATLASWAPRLGLAVCLLALCVAFATRWHHMAESTGNFAANLRNFQLWGALWYGVLALAVLSIWRPRIPFATLFVYGIPTYMAVVMLLGYLRIPYRLSPYDSANRMALHIVPLAFFYFGLKFIPLAGKRGAEITTAAGSG